MNGRLRVHDQTSFLAFLNYDTSNTNANELLQEEKKLDQHDQDQNEREKKYNNILKEKKVVDNLLSESTYIHENFNQLIENKQKFQNKINGLKELMKETDLKRQ